MPTPEEAVAQVVAILESARYVAVPADGGLAYVYDTKARRYLKHNDFALMMYSPGDAQRIADVYNAIDRAPG